jgi:signal transduction histidine kinase
MDKMISFSQYLINQAKEIFTEFASTMGGKWIAIVSSELDLNISPFDDNDIKFKVKEIIKGKCFKKIPKSSKPSVIQTDTFLYAQVSTEPPLFILADDSSDKKRLQLLSSLIFERIDFKTNLKSFNDKNSAIQTLRESINKTHFTQQDIVNDLQKDLLTIFLNTTLAVAIIGTQTAEKNGDATILAIAPEQFKEKFQKSISGQKWETLSSNSLIQSQKTPPSIVARRVIEWPPLMLACFEMDSINNLTNSEKDLLETVLDPWLLSLVPLKMQHYYHKLNRMHLTNFSAPIMDSISINSLLLERLRQELLEDKRYAAEFSLSEMRHELELIEQHVEENMEISVPLKDQQVEMDIKYVVKHSLERLTKTINNITIDIGQLSSARILIYEKAFTAALTEIIKNCILHAFSSLFKEFDNKIIIIKNVINNDRCIFTIADNGKGVDANNLENIFLPGWKASNRRLGGGMGLAYVKNIIEELHSGKCTARRSIKTDFPPQISDPIIDFKNTLKGLAIEISLPLKI